MSATGSVVVTVQELLDKVHRPVKKYTVAWTSDASAGTVSGNALTFTDPNNPDGGPVTIIFNGELLRVVFIPGSGGVQPTNDYVMTLTDQNGIDVLAGQGGALVNTGPSHIVPGVPITDGTTTSTTIITLDDQLILAITGAGNSKQGTVVLYMR